MFVFKILLIILIALPVIALSSYFYSQMLSFIKVKNAIEDEAIRQSAEESEADSKRKNRKKSSKKEKTGKKEKRR